MDTKEVDHAKQLLQQLPASPKIHELDTPTGKKYAFKCQYSNIMSEGRVGIPRNDIKPPKDDKKKKLQTVFCGSFRDWNCAAAWIRGQQRQGKIPEALAKQMMDGVARHGNPQDAKNFCAAPPAEWLEMNSPGVEPALSIKEWTNKYKGGGQFNGYVETASAAHDHREEAKREAEAHKHKMQLENGGEPVTKNAPKPSIRGGTEFVVGNSRKQQKAEVIGGWTACLVTSFASNAKHFESNPGAYGGSFTFTPVPNSDGKGVTYSLVVKSEASDTYVAVHGLQVRGLKRNEQPTEAQKRPKEDIVAQPVSSSSASVSEQPKGKGKKKAVPVAPMLMDEDL